MLALVAFAACRAPSSPATGKDEIDAPLNGESYVQIKPGDFLMGTQAEPRKPGDFVDEVESRERPQHRVLITKAFELGRYEVTQEQWQAVMDANPSSFKGAKLPVTNVSWHDVQEFIKRLQPLDDKHTYRLPTKAEWEYACRAGSAGNFSGEEFKAGDEEAKGRERKRERKGRKPAVRERSEEDEPEEYAKNLKTMGWFSANAFNHPHPVGQLKPNDWGLYDMHGNVWEWCQDWYDFYREGPAEDPPGPAGGTMKINRGGSWQTPAFLCRSAMRGYDLPTERNSLIGFRLVRVKK